MSINDPRDIPDLLAWFSPEAETGYADNDQMNTWIDQSGNGNHATNVGTNPRWRAAGGPGSGPRFEMFAQGMNLPSGLMTGKAAGEVIATILSTSNGAHWKFGTSASANHFPFSGSVYDDFGSTVRRTSASSISTSTWYRYGADSSAGLWRARVNGTETFTTATNTVAWQTQSIVGSGLSGSIGAFVLYGRKLTDTERADLDTWLAANPNGGVPVSGLAVARATETDAARSIVATLHGALGRATETDTARSLAATLNVVLARASETDVAQALTGTLAGTLGRATESDIAQSITVDEADGTVDVALGRALETDDARSIVGTLSGVLGQVAETDIARPISIEIDGNVDVTLGRATETDTAGSLSATTPVGLTQALEIDLARPLTLRVTQDTNTTNRVGGRQRTGYGIAAWTPAMVPTPTPETPGGVDLGGQRMLARAFGTVTMNGAQPTFTVSQATAPKGRQRIIVGGKDVTYFRDVVTPDVTYGLAEPLLFGPGILHLPQVSGIFENPGEDDLYWLDVDKEVIVERVVDDVVIAEDYRGIIVAHWPEGTGLTCELGGEAQGRAALMVKEPPIFRDYLDIGRLAWRAIRSMNLPFEPRLGPVTGIESANFGADTLLTYIDELMARSWVNVGEQWTVMPDETRTYRMTLKDTETVHFTIFTDDAHAVPSLRRDLSAEPNRVYATCITPAGQRVRFGAYPGLQQGRVPAYPMAGDATFNVGTTNEDTIDGFGISVMINRLWVTGFMSIGEKPGGYDEEVRRAIVSLRRRAGAEPEIGPDLGQMDPATWRILWDLDKTGHSLRGSAIQPAAQADYTRPYRRSGSGAIIGPNRKYDPTRSKVDLHVDMGPGIKRRQAQEWSEAELNLGPNYVGTITLTTGAVLAGDVAIGTTVIPEMLMDVRAIRPGMNTRLPVFRGGLFVHVSAVDVAPESVTLTVDTRFRDAPKIWQIMQNNQETKNDPARKRRGGRASSEVKDSIDPWDEIGGTLDNEVDLAQYWTVVPVVTGQEGTISRFELVVQTVTGGEEISIDPSEYCCAVFGREVTAARLNHLLPFPLTEAGTDRWEENSVAAALDALDFLYGAGTEEDPAGFSPGRKSKGASLTGLHTDKAGFAYRSGPEPVVYLAVWVANPTTLKGGRVMWNQLESGA